MPAMETVTSRNGRRAVGAAGSSRRLLRVWLIVAAAGLAVAAGGAWWLFSRAPQVRYTTTPIVRGAIVRSVTASGTVNPQLTVLVGAYVSGTILDITCDFNTRVRRGQVCARIDPRPYQSVVDQDAAQLDVAEAQLAKDRAASVYAQVADRRDQLLLSQNSISHDAADAARSNADQAAAQVALDQATVVQRRAALAAAKVDLDYTDITSPVDGTVVSRNVTQGQTVASSFETPTLFLIATDLTRMQVDANVSESDVAGLKDGDRATFTVDAFPQRTFKAIVTQIRQAPQSVQNVVTYDVVLTVDNTDLALKPGMTATCRIIVAERDGVLRVPSEALRYARGEQGRGQARGVASGPRDHDQVWVLRSGRPVRAAVAAGLSDDMYTEVSGAGLSQGDRVIIGETRGPEDARRGAASPPSMRF